MVIFRSLSLATVLSSMTSLARSSLACKNVSSRIILNNRGAMQSSTIPNHIRSLSLTTSSIMMRNDRILSIRGGGSNVGNNEVNCTPVQSRNLSSDTKFVKLADPAPGSPFHLALPVHNLEIAKDFYGNILGCAEGRSSEKWQDYSLHGHQIVCHWVGDDYKCQDYFNPVDGDEVPVPHFGLALTEEQFHALAKRLTEAGISFIIKPHLRFKGQPGEQWTMFFKDPSGNNLEFKSMTTIENLFAKYNVVD